MRGDRSIGASTAAFVAAVWGVLVGAGSLAVIVLSTWSTHVVTDRNGLTDRVARPGWQVLGAWALAGVVASAAAAVVSASEMLTDRSAARAQAFCTAVALLGGALVATPAGVLTARALGYERSHTAYLATGSVVFAIVTGAIVLARRSAERCRRMT